MTKKATHIIYNERKKAIVIDDNSPQQYQFISLLLGLNTANSLIRLYKIDVSAITHSDYFWLVIGIFSAAALLYRYLKKTSAKEIKLEEIESFKIKRVFGNERYSLILKNGKSRDLYLDFLSKKHLDELFTELGIKTLK
ncbi:hypothetical protein [Namhaeicola litoreus]|uniref:Uncharacterized protein n=1 Tax=Namhaeicola litoreus TaxID=1052145 RepID=A0ABW3Y0J9_9FLAO